MLPGLVPVTLSGTTTQSFPVVAGDNTYSSGGSNLTSHPLNMPISIAAGDLLIAIVALGTNGTTNSISGWSRISGGDTNRNLVYAKIASGSEGSTQSLVLDPAKNCRAVVVRITGAHASMPELTTVNPGGNTATPDPPSETASWGALKNLWLAFTSVVGTARTVTSNPSGFSAVGSGSANVFVAQKNDEIATLDPGVFTLNGVVNVGTAGAIGTIVVRPA